MEMILIAFRDIKANTYLPPIAVPNVQAAIRDIADAIANKKDDVVWAKYPEDFELCEIGLYNTDDGSILTEHDSSTYERKQLIHLGTLKPRDNAQ